VIEAINFCFKRNQTLGYYDFRYNFLMDYGVQAISDMLEEYKWVSKIEIPERISKEVLEQFQERLKANAPKKGKKGKKKKKK
jgi:hypothetical protein